MATNLSQTSANATAAKARLETALDRLDKTIAGNLANGGAGAADQELAPKLAKELDAARAEVNGLKVTNEKVSLRLDGAINKMKLMLDEA